MAEGGTARVKAPILTCWCRSTGARIELSVANVVALSDHSRSLLQAQVSDTRELRDEVRDLRQLVDFRSREDSSGTSSLYLVQRNILPLRLGDSQKGADGCLEGSCGLEVQMV